MSIIKNDPTRYRLRTKLAAASSEQPAGLPVMTRAEVEAVLRQADPHGYANWSAPGTADPA
jgi:hypothetical protein